MPMLEAMSSGVPCVSTAGRPRAPGGGGGAERLHGPFDDARRLRRDRRRAWSTTASACRAWRPRRARRVDATVSLAETVQPARALYDVALEGFRRRGGRADLDPARRGLERGACSATCRPGCAALAADPRQCAVHRQPDRRRARRARPAASPRGRWSARAAGRGDLGARRWRPFRRSQAIDGRRPPRPRAPGHDRQPHAHRLPDPRIPVGDRGLRRARHLCGADEPAPGRDRARARGVRPLRGRGQHRA